jgi:hypothetical protein
MFANGKMRPFETLLRIGRGDKGEFWRRSI